MNLCHIVPSLEERHGGPSKSVRFLCAALASHGDSVQLLATDPAAPRGGLSTAAASLRIDVFPRDWPRQVCPSAGLRRALAALRPAVVHHHSIWLRTLHYAHRHARRHGVPLVVSPRGMMSAWAWRHRRWRKRVSRALIHPGAFEGAAGWHATSAEEERDIRSLGFTQPICVAPNGVAAPVDEDTRRADAFWREACPALAGRRVALFHSRFHRKKRVLELIDLWLERAPPEWLLLLVGIPEDYSAAMLERYAARMGGGGRVRAFAGAGHPSPYPVASLFLLPSHNENFGLVIAEAMAHAVPVVVTDSTPWEEVERQGLGRCVPWAQYPAALDAALREPERALRERGQAARAWVLGAFSWQASARTLAAFYASLVR